jgi:hypothetical protein
MDDELTDQLPNPGPDNHLDHTRALDAARAHVRNGQPDQAIKIWRSLTADGDASCDHAVADYADFVLRQSHGDIEWPALQNMIATRGESPLTTLWAGALLERRGQLVEALTVYSRATEQLTEDGVATSRWALLIASGRRRVKWALGLELSGVDLAGEVGDVEAVDKYFDLLDLLRRPSIARGWAQVWSREELAGARERWPGRVTAESVEAYYREVEGALRGYGERVMIELWTFEVLAKCADAVEQFLSVHRSDGPLPDPTRPERIGVRWPPGRNQPCWCGSERKYKRCCGTGEPAGPPQAWAPRVCALGRRWLSVGCDSWRMRSFGLRLCSVMRGTG